MSLEAERSVLGYLLLSGNGFSEIADVVAAEDFSTEIHQRIFLAAESLAGEGKPTSMILVLPHITGGDETQEQHSREYLAGLCAEHQVATRATLVPYARHIRETSEMRQLAQSAQRTFEQACSRAPGLKPQHIAADMIADADRIASSSLPASVQSVTLGQAGRSAYAETAERRAGKPITGVKTGLADVDDMLGALEPGQGSILAGRPSMGKTAVGVSIAVNVARSGAGVLYVSLEMSAGPLAHRALSLVTAERGAGVPYFRLTRGQVNAVELAAVEHASADLDPLPFVIEQRPGLTVSQIVAKARQVKQQFAAQGTPLRLVIVDHLGLVRPSSRYSGARYLEIGEISAALHALARELDVHCLALAQLNREAEKRDDKRPKLSDLRESGELEQNADVVLSVFREAYQLERSANPEDAVRLLDVENDLELAVLKNRHGPTGRAVLFANMPCNLVRAKEQTASSPPAPTPRKPYLRPVRASDQRQGG